MNYMNSYYNTEQEQQPYFDYYFEEYEEKQEQNNHSPLGVQKKICKKKYQKALKWAHVPSTFSENQTPEKFLLYGNINLFTNYNEDASKCPYSSECLVENGYYKLNQVQVNEKKGIEIKISTLKPCLDKFQFLINLYKRYQSSKYSELANILLQYQKFIKQEFDRSNSMYKQLKKDKNLSTKLQEEFNVFQSKTISEIQASNSSPSSLNNQQYYSYRIVTTNYKIGQPEIKKYGNSESLINLLGISVQNEYQNLLLKMRKQQSFSKNQENHLFRSQESISKAIFMIQNVITQESAYSFSQTLLTRDGFEIPCTVKVQVISNQTLNYIKNYEARDQQVLHYTYIFNKSDIQQLQNKRENMSSQNSTVSAQQISLNINLTLDSCDDSQGSNFILEHTSETFSDIDLNNSSPQQQYQTNKSSQNTLAHKTLNQSFSPISTATCSIQQYNRKLEQKISCDYSRKSQIFINKYYKNLLTRNSKNVQN